MADIKIRMFFTGICGFVPNLEFKTATVLMINAREHPEGFHEGHIRHEAMLLVDSECVVEDESPLLRLRPSVRIKRTGEAIEYRGIPLLGDDI